MFLKVIALNISESYSPLNIVGLGFLFFGWFFFFFFLSFVFSGLHRQHMQVPRLGVESELQPPAYTTATATATVTATATWDPNRVFDYTVAHSSTRSLTH